MACKVLSFVFMIGLIVAAMATVIRETSSVTEVLPVSAPESSKVSGIRSTVRLSAQDQKRTFNMQNICSNGYDFRRLISGCTSFVLERAEECVNVQRLFDGLILLYDLEDDISNGCPPGYFDNIDDLEDRANKSRGDCKKYKNKCDDNDDGGDKELTECRKCVSTCLAAYNKGEGNASMSAALFCDFQPTGWGYTEGPR